ncbi:hypothetical protein [Macrococcoides canis]|uniref:hypothetical protein n=1 Tax=Macrococcoides canis TaxID=1855823 RepID=UPI00165E120B|nr:hypothetical protein [Macrococcus canis]QNR08263.1 hypothetical protein GL258_08320 [Macrococcus canis]UTH01658.1 hypothetical protein KFV05_07990 [Macrococcus canis]
MNFIKSLFITFFLTLFTLLSMMFFALFVNLSPVTLLASSMIAFLLLFMVAIHTDWVNQ